MSQEPELLFHLHREEVPHPTSLLVAKYGYREGLGLGPRLIQITVGHGAGPGLDRRVERLCRANDGGGRLGKKHALPLEDPAKLASVATREPSDSYKKESCDGRRVLWTVFSTD